MLLVQLLVLQLQQEVALLDELLVLDEHLGDHPLLRGVHVAAGLGQQRAFPLDRQRPRHERHDRHRGDDRRQHRRDLRQRPPPEEPRRRADRLEQRAEEDLVVLLRVPQGRGGVSGDDLGAGLGVGRGHLVADLLGHEAAEDLLVAVLGVLLVAGLRLVQEAHDHGLGAGLVHVDFQGVADLGREPLGRAGVHEVLARGGDDLAQLGHLADQVGPVLDDLLAGDRLHRHLAADLHGHAQAVAADELLAVVGHRVGGLAQIQRVVDRVGEVLQLPPQLLLRHHLPHLAVLEVLRRQVAQVRHEPQRRFLRGRLAGRVHEDLDQPDHGLVHDQRREDHGEIRRVPPRWASPPRPRPAG